jgi:hypothetical protein
MTQRDRVLRQLKRTGRVSPVDFLLPDICDGQTPITRLAPRIKELRDEGFEIETRIAPNHTAVYSLINQQTELLVAA